MPGHRHFLRLVLAVYVTEPLLIHTDQCGRAAEMPVTETD